MANLSLLTAIPIRAGNMQSYLCAMSVGQLVREVAVNLSRSETDGRRSAVSDAPPSQESGESVTSCIIVGVDAERVRFLPFEMVGDNPLYAGLNRGAGMLAYDGLSQFVAVSGQSLLRELKRELRAGNLSAKDEYSVQIVPLQAAAI